MASRRQEAQPPEALLRWELSELHQAFSGKAANVGASELASSIASSKLASIVVKDCEPVTKAGSAPC